MELGAEITGIIPALITVYFVEVGLILVVAPWTTFWDRNYFVESFPFLEAILTSHVGRGGVTGVGLVSLGAALADVAFAIRWLVALWRSPAPPDDSILADTTPRSGLV